MSRFCEQCGAKLEPNENFCPSCGAKVIRDEQPTYTPPKPPPQQNYTPPTSTPVNSTAPPAENHMGKFLALIGIFVLIGVVMYHANKQADETLGGFYIGMSKAEIDRKFVKNWRNRDGSYSYSSNDVHFSMKFDSQDKAKRISSQSDTVHTKKGIHPGSTLDEVIRAYGNNYILADNMAHILADYIYTLGNSQLVFTVSEDTNRVWGITLETTEETSLGGFYLGMSKDEADEKFGAGVPSDRGYSYWNGYYSRFWLEFNEYNKAVMIICYDKAVSTKKRIHVGSTLAEVKRAYGTDYEFDNTTFTVNPAYIYTVGSNRLFFFIDTATDTVLAIRLNKGY